MLGPQYTFRTGRRVLIRARRYGLQAMDHLQLRGFVIVGQDWDGPQGVGTALQRVERLAGLVLMNTWLFTGDVGRFYTSPRPWTTWHAPLIGQFL